ncbi:YcfA family protein [Stanieria cyanosphaera PCC 7437]|uniref:YcfA family protein n=1 Tax=Stanieria cyanosphaera (strain ATCC 29371 / PCC 7437) TaxID=111780 RepID=K9XXP1_STAC7|nr:type II toxin-antitoxin system HicA family toxin [Stanieria cyanosphaera]AFZ36871.1 YcfA family protein [Stanieria cyanosphaera PCC 7437]
MPKLPALTGDAVIRVLEKVGFQKIRQKGSHIRMKHIDGRVVTIPIHRGKTIGKGLLRKIIRDAELTQEEFIALLE